MTEQTCPNAIEKEQSLLAYEDLLELVNRFIKEGMHPAAILAALGSVCTHFVMMHRGPEKVSEWFALNSAMTMQLAPRGGSTPSTDA